MGTDTHKERERTLIANEIEGLITRLTNISNQAHELLSQLAYATGGSHSSQNASMERGCRQAIQEISRALQELCVAKRCVANLNTSTNGET